MNVLESKSVQGTESVSNGPGNDENLQQLCDFLTGGELQGEVAEWVPLAMTQKVAAFLLYRCKQEGLQPSDHPEIGALLSASRQHMAQYLLQERTMIEVDAALVAAGIEPVWIKGAALATTVYPQPTLRPQLDLDLIVAEADFQRALGILHRMGYASPDLGPKSPIDHLSHHAHMVHETFPSVILELHHKLLGPEGHDHLPADHLEGWLGQTLEFQIFDRSLRTLKPEIHFLYLCAHALLQHGEALTVLRDLLDLHLLATSYELDWDFVVEEAAELGWTSLVERALALIQRRFETPIPAHVAQSLARRRSPHNLADDLLLKNGGDIRGESVLRMFRHLTPLGRLRAAWHLAVPDRDYMRRRYGIAPGASVVPSYLYRWLDQSRGLIKALAHRGKVGWRSTKQRRAPVTRRLQPD